MNAKRKLVFDIETVGMEFTDLDVVSQEYLRRKVQKRLQRDAVDEENFEGLLEVEKDNLGFSPLTAHIVAIGVYNPDTQKGAVKFQAPDSSAEPVEEEGIVYSVGAERELLQWFWETILSYDEVVSFNGRRFDAPFLMIRSAIHRIQCARNLYGYRYASDTFHIDLADQLSFYGELWSRSSLTLHFWCRAFGIESPKGDIEGEQVKQFFKEGKYTEIAKYCAKDLKATSELYTMWDAYLRFARRP